MIESGVHPRSILACTFTKKAAQEMKARLVHEVGERAKQVRMETMHAVAFRLLREMNPQVEVLVDSTHVVEWALEKESGNLREQVDANEWMMRIMRQKSEGIMPEQVEDPDLQRMYATYERLKTNSKRVDFEDLIVMTLQALRKKDRVALTWREGIEYVLVDEFQDTNRAQWEWLKEVAAPRRNLFCVGDDWQSIYGFRGSRPELMQEMKEKYVGTKMYYLTRNYRSFFVIVGLSNDLINHFNQGFHIDKVVKPGVGRDDEYSGYAPFEVDDEQAEANMVARVILNRHFPFRGYAVLYRTNAQSQIYAEALSEQGIPYEVVGDTPFFASKRVKAALDYLRTSIDTENADHWRGIINQPNRRIGLTEIEELVELGWRGIEDHRNLWDLTSAIEELQRRESPADGLRWLLTSGMKELAYAKDDEPVKWVDVLLRSASKFKTKEAFLAFVERTLRESKPEEGKDAVQLMSIHRSKGLEFNTVFIVGAVEGFLPHERSAKPEEIREETRLFYVAMTRAKDQLYCSAPKSYMGKLVQRSRYMQYLYDLEPKE
nr:ATP-dependent helicase [Sulfoacidibacillus ferrooxidans]